MWENWELLFTGLRVLVAKWKVFRMDGDDGSTRGWICLMPLNCILKNSKIKFYVICIYNSLYMYIMLYVYNIKFAILLNQVWFLDFTKIKKIKAEREQRTDTCYDVDESGKRSKWQKPDLKGHLSYGSFYASVLDKSRETKSGLEVTEKWGSGRWEGIT